MKEYVKKYWMYGLIVLVLVVTLLIPKDAPKEIDVVSSPSVEIEEESQYIYVDLKGYVKNPGVYKLESDARLFEVINLAGGLLDIADSLAINMSMSLEDEMAIYIPSIYDNVPPVTVQEEEEQNSLIDINQAGLTLLETLPGIGPSTAQNIIDYRDEEGYFETIEDILNVPNIGDSTFEQIKDLITVEE